MGRRFVSLLVLLVGVASLTGCAQARFVQVNPNDGIVAIPSNSNSWPDYYRDQAEKLMREKCPKGYDIVLEREEVTGQVAHTNSHTETSGPPTVGFGGLSVAVGNGEERTHETTEYSNVTEWRNLLPVEGRRPVYSHSTG